MLSRRHLTSLVGYGLLLPRGHVALAATRSPSRVFNVRDYGARADGITIDSPAIDRAINAAASHGGGTVYFPAGTYASYTVHLQSNVSLYLENGAILLAANTPLGGLTSGGYDRAEPQPEAINAFQDYGHNHWRNSLIYGEGLHNIAILGEGLIWGKGLSRGHNDPDLPRAEAPGVGCKAIALKQCHNVHLADFKVLQGGWFALLATGVDNLVIDNLTIDTNRDGLDIDCCHNVRVSNCTINSPYDDAIVPKSSFALGYPRDTKDITITNCFVTGSYEVGSLIDDTWKPIRDTKSWRVGRIKCGTESNGGFKNITISNCVFDKCWGLALEAVDGAQIEDITITNVAMREGGSAPIFIRLGARMRGPAGTAVGTIKRILINNVTCANESRLPIIIAGVEGYPVEDLKISNVFLSQAGGADATLAEQVPPDIDDKYPEPNMFGDTPAAGAFIRHARNVEISHVELAVRAKDARAAFWLDDVDGFDASFINTPKGVPSFTLSRVKDFRVFACRDIADRRINTVSRMKF